jgi:RNA polymerase sigma-70 factor (ECF subfamily)
VQIEESLVKRAQQRDQVALTQIYEENFDRIYRYIVIKIGDRTEAEDMTQQVFLNAIKSIHTYQHKGMPLSSWLYRIAHNQIVDYWRKKSKHRTVPLEKAEQKAGSDDPRAVAELHIEIEELAKASKMLTKSQQEVIALRFSGGLSVLETARAMGKSEGAVKALQHSAIASLRKLLSAGAAQ